MTKTVQRILCALKLKCKIPYAMMIKSMITLGLTFHCKREISKDGQNQQSWQRRRWKIYFEFRLWRLYDSTVLRSARMPASCLSRTVFWLVQIPYQLLSLITLQSVIREQPGHFTNNINFLYMCIWTISMWHFKRCMFKPVWNAVQRRYCAPIKIQEERDTKKVTLSPESRFSFVNYLDIRVTCFYQK